MRVMFLVVGFCDFILLVRFFDFVVFIVGIRWVIGRFLGMDWGYEWFLEFIFELEGDRSNRFF